MEIGTEISQKIRSAIKAKLIEQGAYVDDELPDYIMVMVANKKSQKQMTEDLSLFLGTNTDKFTAWLHGLLKKLQSINTDDAGSKPKSKEKEKHKGEKRKHKPSQGDKEKSGKVTEGEKPRKLSTEGERQKKVASGGEGRKGEEKAEVSTARVKPVQTTEEDPSDEIKIIENTDEFNEENNEAEIKEQVKTSSTGKPPTTKVTKSDKSSGAKKSSTRESSKSKSAVASKHVKSESKDQHRKPSSFVASVKRRYEEIEDEEYDPANPAVGSVASVVRGPQRKSSVPKSLQANKSLLMKAVTEAEKSVTTNKKPDSESKPSMRSDRQPVDLKKRLKTAAGIGLLSRSKRTELEALKYRADSEPSKDSAKKPRRSNEGFENMKYTIRNESAPTSKSPPKKTPPKTKAPVVAPSRVAASAFREMGHRSKVVVKKEDKESESDSEQEYGPPLPDTRLVQRTQVDEDTNDATDSNSRPSSSRDISEDNASPDPEIQQLLNEAHETLDLNEDLVYEEDNTRNVRDTSSSSPEPRFIVTLDGVDPEAYSTLPEVRQNPVQTVKPVQKQKPVTEQQQQLKASISESEAAEQLFAKIAPTKIKPFNINLKDTDDEDEGEEMETDDVVKATINERCRFWPACANGNECQYIHPTIPCKTFPYCKFGEKCMYIHPNCRFDAKCTRLDCPYTHSSKRMGLMAPKVIHKIVQVPMQTYIPQLEQYQPMKTQSTQCRFFPNCRNMACPFTHPKPCRYGIGCMNKSTCTFHHPPLPGADKLKWSSAGNKETSNTTVATGSTDVKK